jgi:tetratricopeptide (TPR) repeat protein
MFRNIIILLFLVLINPVLLLAQDEVAPLIEKMQKANGIEKADLMNEISVVYRKTDRYKALDFARQAFELSVKANYLPGKALAKKNEGICWFFIGSNDSASLCYGDALAIFSKIGDEKGMSACYNNLGLISQETGKYNEALKFYTHSVEMDTRLNDQIGAAQTKENMASIYIYKGYVKTALKLTNECLKIYTAQDYKPGILASYSNRGAEFAYLKQFDNAIRDFMKTLSLSIELKDKYQEIIANSNLGYTYWSMKKPEIAMKYLNLALEMSDENDDAFNIDKTLTTMADIFTSEKDYAKSIDILQKLLKRNEDSENVRQASAIMTSISRNLIELNEIDKAIGYLNKSLQITVKINARYELLENYRNLAHANAILHSFSTADSLQDLFAETYMELFNSDSIANLRKENLDIGDSATPSDSTTSDWIIAFSLMAIVFLISVIAYRDNKKVA